MRRGTTPTHIFTTSIDLSQAQVIYVTYQQKGKTIVERTKDDIEVTDKTIKVKLTQEETLAFTEIGTIRMQIRARFEDGTAVACEVIERPSKEILKEGVI